MIVKEVETAVVFWHRSLWLSQYRECSIRSCHFSRNQVPQSKKLSAFMCTNRNNEFAINSLLVGVFAHEANFLSFYGTGTQTSGRNYFFFVFIFNISLMQVPVQTTQLPPISAWLFDPLCSICFSKFYVEYNTHLGGYWTWSPDKCQKRLKLQLLSGMYYNASSNRLNLFPRNHVGQSKNISVYYNSYALFIGFKGSNRENCFNRFRGSKMW